MSFTGWQHQILLPESPHSPQHCMQLSTLFEIFARKCFIQHEFPVREQVRKKMLCNHGLQFTWSGGEGEHGESKMSIPANPVQVVQDIGVRRKLV